MMNTVYFDPKFSDEERRKQIYSGQIVVFSPRPSIKALADHARQMIEEAFAPLDPLTAQFHMSVEDYVAIGAPLKPKFIHHPRTKELIRDLLLDLQCEAEKTYLDVPRLRLTTSNGYLTSGVGYAFHPHRDTWYSAPMNQLNWWMPIYDFASESSMAFHPRYWTEPVQNGSRKFNYYEWNSNGRKNAAQQIHKDERVQPKPEQEIELDPQVRVVCPAGGIILFSAAQLHSTVPNTSGLTRYSVDFRTVNMNDVVTHNGAPNIDSECTGTSLRDFMRCTDFTRLPENVVSTYDTGPVKDGVLVYQPQ